MPARGTEKSLKLRKNVACRLEQGREGVERWCQPGGMKQTDGYCKGTDGYFSLH